MKHFQCISKYHTQDSSMEAHCAWGVPVQALRQAIAHLNETARQWKRALCWLPASLSHLPPYICADSGGQLRVSEQSYLRAARAAGFPQERSPGDPGTRAAGPAPGAAGQRSPAPAEGAAGGPRRSVRSSQPGPDRGNRDGAALGSGCAPHTAALEPGPTCQATAVPHGRWGALQMPSALNTADIARCILFHIKLLNNATLPAIFTPLTCSDSSSLILVLPSMVALTVERIFSCVLMVGIRSQTWGTGIK